MSKGFGGHAKLVSSDDKVKKYEYYCYDANTKDYEKYIHVYDGEIVFTIESYDEFPENCDVWIENAGGTTHINTNEVDIVAIKIIREQRD